MSDDQYAKCHAAIHTASIAAGATGAGVAQLPCSDSIPIMSIQVTMTIAIGKIFDTDITSGIAWGLIKSQIAKIVGRSVSQLLVGWMPGIGNAINASTAAILTERFGWGVAELFAKQATLRRAITDGSMTHPIKIAAKPEYGDVICIHRPARLIPPLLPYDHYGVYESDNCVYAFSTESGDFIGGEAMVRTMSLENFMEGDDELRVLKFPKRLLSKGKPVEEYHLMTPQQTVERARASLGKMGYNILTNNCEHFAIWCKTDMHVSYQVDDALDALMSFV